MDNTLIIIGGAVLAYWYFIADRSVTPPGPVVLPPPPPGPVVLPPPPPPVVLPPPIVAPFISVSGKVLSPGGLALRNVEVMFTNNETNVPRLATSTSFGIYSFIDIPRGIYTVTAAAKRYRFAPRLLTVTGDLTNVDITGLE